MQLANLLLQPNVQEFVSFHAPTEVYSDLRITKCSARVRRPGTLKLICVNVIT